MASKKPAWRRLGRENPTTQPVEKLLKEKEWCLMVIKDYEERKADCQACLSSSVPTSVGGWPGEDLGITREDLVRAVQTYEFIIPYLQQHLRDCKTSQQYKALTSVANRDQFTLSSKQECVAYDTLTGTMSGFAGSGKTHTLAMVTREEPPSLRVSTPLSQVPTRTITQTRIGKAEGAYTRMSDEEFTDCVVLSAKERVSSLMPSTVTYRVACGIRELFAKSSLPTDPMERELITKFHTLDQSVMSLKGQVVLEISDCGGQTQFLEILPRYIESIDFSILVTNLSQCFNQYPINYFFTKDGKSVGKGVLSPLTNEQVLRLHFQMIASLSQGDRRPIMAVVGTHRDLEGTCVHQTGEGECRHKGECIRSREEKNQRLKEIVELFGLEDSVITRTHNEFIFAVNAKKPEKTDYQTIDHLMDCIMEKCTPRPIQIPLSYHALELALKRMAQESGHLAFKESVLLTEVSNYHFDEESLKDGLRYLHKKRRAFYYEKVFPGRVLGEPQAILNKQTELVVYNIQLASNPETLDREQWRFVKYGFLTISILKKFPDHYVEGVFTPEDMLQLFVKLLMVSEVGKGEYLMPCVLSTDPLANCNPEPDTQSVPPMVLHFPGGPTRYGVFCGTICHVMTKSKWELVKDPVTDEPFHITRNSVHLRLPGCRNKVTLNDPFSSFFVVTLHIPSDVPAYSETVSCLCIKVRDTLIDAIASVTRKLNYTAGPPTISFLCTEHKDIHPATVSDMGDELLCTKDGNAKGGTLTMGHRVWLRDSSSTEPYPDLTKPCKTPMPSNEHATKFYPSTCHTPSSPLPQADDSTPTVNPQLGTLPQSGNSSPQSGDDSTPTAPPSPPPTLSSSTAPSLRSLNLLKWRDEQGREQTFRLVDSVSAKWEGFGILLGLEYNQISAIKLDCPGRTTECWNRVMEQWRQGVSPDYPATWTGLYSLLRDMEYERIADTLEAAVEKASPQS